jgi:two-component system phosphate regulon response regulator PhoB
MAATGKALVMIVEDEPAQQQVLKYNLTANGYDVLVAGDGEEALLLLEETPPDLVLLDWMLPEVSGLEICRRMKTRPATRDIPVIMLSARSEEVDRVRGLDTGADDYVVKPYSVSELMARVKGNLRRINRALDGQIMVFEDISLDPETHRVFRGDREVHLGPTEYRLLSAFLEKPGRVWGRDQLLDKVWGRDVYVDTRTVDVHVGRLRKALMKEGDTNPIRTIRGSGYALG